MGQALQHHVAQEHFRSPVLEAIMNISVAASSIRANVEEACTPLGLTAAQYHILRILTQQPLSGLSRNDIVRRLIEKSVDVTRSINNLVSAGYVVREPDEHDRRIVLHKVTRGGIEALAGIDTSLRKHMMRIADSMSEEELSCLSRLCEKISLAQSAVPAERPPVRDGERRH